MMNFGYQFIDYEFGLPVKIFINSANINKPHFHKGLELIWVLDGRLNMLIEGDEYSLQENDLFLVNSYSVHHILDDQYENTFLAMQIDRDFCLNYLRDFGSRYFEVKSFKNSRDNQEQYDFIRHFFSKIVWLYNKKVKNFHEEICKELVKLIEYMDDHFAKTDKRPGGVDLEKRDWLRFKNITEYIDENFQEKLTLQEIAEREHYSVSYLSESFKKNVGLSFTDYLDKIRLQNAMPAILYGDKSMTEIAYDNGFPSLKSFYRAFRKYYNVTPLEYRNNFGDLLANYHDRKQELKIFDINKKLNSYFSQTRAEGREAKSKRELVVDIGSSKGMLHNVWQKMINIGSAGTILDYNLQKQIKEAQKDIGFEYLRFEGIFNDELEVCKEDKDGNIYYNWKQIDRIFDFLIEQDLKPFVCLGFMPEALSRTGKTAFFYKANASPPKKMEKWLDLVRSFLLHCLNRYGSEEVEQWYFQVWHEFSLFGIHWDGTDEEYHEFYKATAEQIKAISPRLVVGPAAENYYTGYKKTEELLRFCRLKEVPIDFYCVVIYHNKVSNMNTLNFSKDEFFDDQLLFDICFSYYDKNHTLETIRRTRELIDIHYQKELPLMVVRWNFSWDVKELIHDTAFMAPSIIDNVLKAQSLVAGMGFLSLSDILHEWPVDGGVFYGGSGLINTAGIKKSAYYAFLFLSKLGPKIVKQGNYYIVTKNKEEIQILLYNHVYLDQIYMSGNDSAISEMNRYDVFQEENTLQIDMVLDGVKGRYKLVHYYLSKEDGSAFDEWLALGAPCQMTEEEIDYLKRKAHPKMSLGYQECVDRLEIKTEIPPHGAQLILVRQIYE